MTMFPSACMWSYRTPMSQALLQIEQTAFHFIDVEPDTLDDPDAARAQKDLGLKVSCVALDHRMPRGLSLEGKNGVARGAIDALKQSIEKSASLGAAAAYVTAGKSRRHLEAFGEALRELAGHAAEKGIKLCVEHAPGGALPTAGAALGFIDKINHPNLFLLLDVGHAMLSGEKAWELAASAGNRLGYVQMNDNDGKADRHWPLLEGKLTSSDLQKILDSLARIGYQSTLGLELSFDRASLVSGFSRNRNLLIRMQEGLDHKFMLEPEARRKP